MRVSYEKLIQDIEKTCSAHFLESTFKLKREGLNKFILKGENFSSAINNIRKEKKLVQVLKWFKSFWIYLEISFVTNDNEFPNTFITISVFQGDSDDSFKTQLFRAEWDNYVGNDRHPQPHWHVYPFKYDSKTYEDFETFNEMKSEDGFEELISPNHQTNKLIDIREFHFAMNGQWTDKKTHIHKIDKEDIIVTWLDGVIAHIKEQLIYVE